MTTALNENGGSKRLRFESLSETLQRTNIDVVHRVLAQSKLSKSFSGTSRALLESHFLSELQESKSLECARSFQRSQTRPYNLFSKVVSLIWCATFMQDLLSYVSSRSISSRITAQ